MADEVVPQSTGENKAPKGRNVGIVITIFGIGLLIFAGVYWLFIK
jgi:hypothetical protein